MDKKSPKIDKCECPETGRVDKWREQFYSSAEKSGMNHLPNKCKGTNDLKKYKRGEKELTLCSCCRMPFDIEVKNHTQETASTSKDLPKPFVEEARSAKWELSYEQGRKDEKQDILKIIDEIDWEYPFEKNNLKQKIEGMK